MICCKTIIGWGAPNKQGTKATHGEALGVDEVAASRKQLQWTSEAFVIPQPMLDAWNHKSQGAASEEQWRELFARYRVGDTVTLHAFRRDELMQFSVTLQGERVPNVVLAPANGARRAAALQRPSAS